MYRPATPAPTTTTSTCGCSPVAPFEPFPAVMRKLLRDRATPPRRSAAIVVQERRGAPVHGVVLVEAASAAPDGILGCGSSDGAADHGRRSGVSRSPHCGALVHLPRRGPAPDERSTDARCG